jgi:endonuclease YncB( thermonuclease family)
MGGWEKSPDYGGGWGGGWSTAAAAGVIAAIAFALVSCSQAAEPQPAPESAAIAQEAQQGGDNDACTAPLPSGAGTEFAGVVRHVIDGDSICVGPADGDGSTWIEIRLMDFDAPEARQPGGAEAEATLSRLVLNREAQCTVTRSNRSGATQSYDRVHAVCRVDGRTIGDAMRAAGANEGGN